MLDAHSDYACLNGGWRQQSDDPAKASDTPVEKETLCEKRRHHRAVGFPIQTDRANAKVCPRILRNRAIAQNCREFSDKPVPRDVIENCLRAAGTAPSGANRQPWHFSVVSDPDLKRKIRAGAEAEEKSFMPPGATGVARRSGASWY